MKFLCLFILTLGVINHSLAEEKPNILFIALDDMNDWTGFLGGHPQAKTPNLDKLAHEGVNFTNAHCSAPGCSPSRNALLYGIEPFNSGLYPFYNEEAMHLELQKKYISLPRLMKDGGYRTFAAGKIHHAFKDNDLEWTEYLDDDLGVKSFRKGEGYQIGDSSKMSFRPTTNAYEDHSDYKVASYGIDVLNREHDKPFFLAVGIVKPHLAFDCPQEFFDALPEQIMPPAIKADDLNDLQGEARSMSSQRDDKIFKKDEAWNRVRRAYLACISWADYNVGRVIDALKKSRYADNTLIVLWSDHGYHMGEKMTFRKFTLWEESTRVPFIIHDTREKESAAGRTCSQAVSLINVYKTVADYAGIEVPGHVDGFSLRPQYENPAEKVPLPAYITWGRGNYSVRSDHWRYTRYYDGTEELYQHKKDSNEWHNLAANPEFKAKKDELAAKLPKNEAPTAKGEIAAFSLRGKDRAKQKKKKKLKEKK